MISRACSNPFKMCCTSLKLQGLSPMTTTYNVERTILICSLHIEDKRKFCSDPSWENVHVVENHQIATMGFYFLLHSLHPYGFSPHICHPLFVPSSQLTL